MKYLLLGSIALLIVACEQQPIGLREVPEAEAYCLAAQKIVTQTMLPVKLIVHEDFNDFVKSKAIIDEQLGPVIQQYNWEDENGALLGISCKLKSADHLTLVYGEGKAGPDGKCQQMNQAVFDLVAKQELSPVYTSVTFDPLETVSNAEQPGMTGPDWLAPFTMTYVEADVLHIATKGFVVDFTDPRYAKAPERFRGVHYCHLIAPEYLGALLAGDLPAGAVIGREVDLSGPPPHAQ